jgi:tetratricopeptide (TPR) repeat protein
MKKYDEAIKAFHDAGKLLPLDANATALLQLAEKGQAEVLTGKVQGLLKSATNHIAAKKFDLAMKDLDAASLLAPKDAAVLAAQKQLAKARNDYTLELKNKTAYDDAVMQGKSLLGMKKYEEAIAAFQKAAIYLPLDAAAKADLAQAQTGLAGVQKTRTAYDNAVKQGQTLLKLKKYDEAIKAFQDADKLLKLDANAQALLKMAEKGRDDQLNAQKNKLAYDEAVKHGKSLLEMKKYDDAIKAFQDANKLLPLDPSAAALLKQAQKAHDDLINAQKNKIAYDEAVQQGQTLLKMKKYDEAIKAFQKASIYQQLDASAKALLKDAEKGRDDLLHAQKNKMAYDDAVKLGQSFLQQKKYDEAIKAFQQADKILPLDPSAKALLKLAEKGHDDLINAQKNKLAYDEAVKQGLTFLQMKKYDEAIKALQKAGMYMQLDANAKSLLMQAEKGQQEVKKVAEFNTFMKEGKAALDAKKFMDAVKYYTEATKLFPTDPTAAAQLKEANRQWDLSKTPVVSPAQKMEYDKQMKLGAAADKLKKWDDAIKAYEAALKQIPKDAKANYSLHMAQGNQYLMQKQYQKAITEFEAALVLYPNDPDATAALKKAKDMM